MCGASRELTREWFNSQMEQGAQPFMWHPVAKSASLPAWANLPFGSFTGLHYTLRILIFKTACGLGAPVVKKTLGQPE